MAPALLHPRLSPCAPMPQLCPHGALPRHGNPAGHRPRPLRSPGLRAALHGDSRGTTPFAPGQRLLLHSQHPHCTGSRGSAPQGDLHGWGERLRVGVADPPRCPQPTWGCRAMGAGSRDWAITSRRGAIPTFPISTPTLGVGSDPPTHTLHGVTAPQLQHPPSWMPAGDGGTPKHHR